MDQSGDRARAAPAMASRSASMAGLSSQGGGIIGGGVPFLIASPSRDTTSMTSGGGRVPATPSAIAASAIRWLAFSAATRRARCQFRPVAVDLALSSSSYAVLSALVSACRRAVNWSVPTTRSSSASAAYTAATSRCSRPCGDRSQPGRIRISAQATPTRNPAAVCQTGRSAPTGPMPSEVYTSSCSPVAEPMSPIALSTPDTPATTTRAITASQPWPWTADPMARPAAPPNTAALQTRFTRLGYGPSVSAIVPSNPPIAGSTPREPLPSASDTDSGTQIASAARIISGQGTGAGRGRTTSASHSGMTAARIAAARPPSVLIMAGLRSSLPAAAHHLFLSSYTNFLSRTVLPHRPGPLRLVAGRRLPSRGAG